MLRCSNCSSVRGFFRSARPVSGTERPRLSLPPGTLTLRDYKAASGMLVIQWCVKNSKSGVAHLFEPLKSIGGEVVALGMGDDILSQGGKDGLEIGALGCRSHYEECINMLMMGHQRRETIPPSKGAFPRGGTVWWVCTVCRVCLGVAVSPGATRGLLGLFKPIE